MRFERPAVRRDCSRPQRRLCSHVPLGGLGEGEVTARGYALTPSHPGFDIGERGLSGLAFRLPLLAAAGDLRYRGM